MQKKIFAIIIVVLIVAACVFAVMNRGSSKEEEGLIIAADGKEITLAWDDIKENTFEGTLVNGKGEKTEHSFTGDQLVNILSENGVEISEDSSVTATSEDNYSAELTGSELIEPGRVFVALTDGGEQIEGIEGGQGAQLVVFGDPNSKRAVRYLKRIDVE